MKQIPVFYTEAMFGETESFSPSALKPKLVIKDWTSSFESKLLITEFAPLTKQIFYLSHSPKHVDDIFSGIKPNGFGTMDRQFAETFYYTAGSLYAAAKEALNSGVAVSPTSGFHHAGYAKAEGFCTFNGLIITAQLLKQENLISSVGILDCDMHYGNGTDDIIDKLDLMYIKHYTAGREFDLYYPAFDFVKPFIKRIYHLFIKTSKKGTSRYHRVSLRQRLLHKKSEKFLGKLPAILKSMQDCDLIIYQAGADQHVRDPYGGLLTNEQMILRDNLVFEFCKKHHIPLVWNLAGGYQKDSVGDIEPVLGIHRNTMNACIATYC